MNPRMITLARESAGLTQTALAHAVGISQALLSRIEHGLDEPSDQVLDGLARECDVPAAFFHQQDAVLGEGMIEFFHRKRLTLPARPLRKSNALVNKVRLEVMRLLRTVELTDVAPFPDFPIGEYDSPTEVAGLVRATWRIPPGPLPDLVALIEATGAPVLLLPLGHEKLSAISMPGEQGRHVIVLNDHMPASHQRFALAHELGHLVMHNGTISQDLEHEADQFASALLMPPQDIRPSLKDIKFGDLGRLKPVWRVSLAALIRTAHSLNCITDRTYRYYNMQLNNLPGGRKREPGEFPREEPRLLRHIIQHYQADLGYSIEEVAKLMVTNVDDVRQRYLGERVHRLRPVGRGEGAVIHTLPVPRPS